MLKYCYILGVGAALSCRSTSPVTGVYPKVGIQILRTPGPAAHNGAWRRRGFQSTSSRHILRYAEKQQIRSLQMAQTDELLTVPEVAELLGVSLSAIYSGRHDGRGPAGWRRGKRLV